MKLEEWPQWAQLAAALLVATIVMGVLLLAVADGDDASPESEARYVQVRAECTAAANSLGFVGRQRIEAINDCMLDRY